MRFRSIVTLLFALTPVVSGLSAADFQFGFSKVDITPTTPVRLSGYGNRDQPYTGIDEQLFARAMAMTSNGPDGLHVLVSVDTIGFPGVLTKEIHEEVQRKHAISRSRFVICGTHSHTSPHLVRGLSNLYSTPLTDEETMASTAYTNFVLDQILQAVDLAIQNLSPGKIATASGTATFARNRRVLKEGVWTGFGENPAGPVDHSLPILRITDITGEQTRGLIFNYACHCTTFGGDYNRVNGDWAGYASKFLEEQHAGTIALCTIGCGADANPERNSEHAFEIAQRQGGEIAEEVSRLLQTQAELKPLSELVSTNFGFAGLPIDRPGDDLLRENLKSPRQQVRHHAEVMIETKQRMGRLPETYPMPIQVWRFGDEFAMVFLGGEVCVEYALRIKQELSKLVPGLAPERVWVTAYANDVFAYVVPERMRAEGGYEVDFSMIYYLQPGRWSTGTEEVIIRRVRELFQSQNLDVPLSVIEAIKTFTLPEGFALDVIAAEPLIRDPINFAVDAQGRLWVVEMGDYPRGNPEGDLTKVERHEPWDGPPAGRIRLLVDTNRDGIYDTATTFLSGLSFPTGVFPWKDGVLISGAPDIIFARDTNADLICDETEVLYSGFEEANPQHRIGGFEYGLDGWLYLSAGTNNTEILCRKSGETVNISGRDCRIHPQSGRLEAVSGRSQYGRCRDAYGNWFGNSNSQPLFQFVIEDRDLSRNPHVPSPAPRQFLTSPPNAPPVYPTSRTLDRFNDLHALNRFTSACSPSVFKNDTLGRDVQDSVFICEPVHNLVSRVQVDRSTIEFSGERHPDELQSEFLSSTDNWFRPVRLMTAPDGSLWICDMYRHIIEHPEWIPEAWQSRLDLYAGYNQGRIYRLYRTETPPQPIPDLTHLDTTELVNLLGSSNGWTRDTAQQLLIERASENNAENPKAEIVRAEIVRAEIVRAEIVRAEIVRAEIVRAEIVSAVNQFIESHDESRSLIQARWTLSLLPGTNLPPRNDFESQDPDVVINALRIWGTQPNTANVSHPPFALVNHPSERVRFELALAAGNAEAEVAASILRQLMQNSADNAWIRVAILSSSNSCAEKLLSSAFESGTKSSQLLNPLLATLLGNHPSMGISQLGLSLAATESLPLKRQLLLRALEYLERKQISVVQIQQQLDPEAFSAITNLIDQTIQDLNTRRLAPEDAAIALSLVSFHPDALTATPLLKYLDATHPPATVSAAIVALLRARFHEELIDQLRLQTPATQAEIQANLLTHPTALSRLLLALEEQKLGLNDLTAATRDALQNHRTVEIKERFQKLTLLEPERPSRQELMEAYRPALSLPGNTEQGRALFTKSCSSCHRHQDIGNDFGPKLSTLAQKTNDYLLTAILDPNAAVEAKYRSYAVATHNGKVFSGLIIEETATSIKLIRPDGKAEMILRTEIEEMVNTGRSFMPEGLEKTLTPQNLADLLLFIKTE